ncbi:MAG TPA: hypothetical protein PKK38_06650, partial [Bacteroidales bacterium]|nr:hypothetical protein [Bacteroidales bacterium]
SISQKFSLYINELVDDVTDVFSDYITYTDDEGNICAEEGLVINTNTDINANIDLGSEWEIVKDLKNYPSHEEGGIDLNIKS